MYKVIQLTNQVIGAVAAGELLPLGAITRRYGCRANSNSSVFEVSTTGSNTVTLLEEGYYHLTFNGSLTAAAVGDIVLNLLINNVEIISATGSTAAVGDFANISLSYVIRVLPSCNCVSNPAVIQIGVDDTSVALTGGVGNLIIEKVR